MAFSQTSSMMAPNKKGLKILKSKVLRLMLDLQKQFKPQSLKSIVKNLEKRTNVETIRDLYNKLEVIKETGDKTTITRTYLKNLPSDPDELRFQFAQFDEPQTNNRAVTKTKGTDAERQERRDRAFIRDIKEYNTLKNHVKISTILLKKPLTLEEFSQRTTCDG